MLGKLGLCFASFFSCLNFHSPVWLIKLDRWLILQLAVSLWVELWCVLSREVVCVIVRLWNPSDVQILAIIHGRLRIRLQDVSIIGSNIWACDKLQRNRRTDWMIFFSSCFFFFKFTIENCVTGRHLNKPVLYIFKMTTYHRKRVSGASSVSRRGRSVRCILRAQVQSGRRRGGNGPLQCLNLTVGQR